MSRLLVVVGLIVSLLVPTSSIAAASGPGGSVAASSVRQLGTGSRIPWQDGNWFLMGANVPWLNWAKDFGGGPKNGGVSSADSQAALNDAFATAKDNGANVVRWWVFEGDAWQVKRDGSGAPTGLDQSIYQDFDAAVQLAEAHDLYLTFMLFNPDAIPGTWMSNAGQRAKLAAALTPLFARYADNPHVMTWEVFNEPDLEVWKDKIKQDDMRATVKAIADAVHGSSPAYVTVGMGMIDGLPMVTGLGLDYYQAHWYPYMDHGGYCAGCRDYASVVQEHSLDAPLVVGEMYLGADVKDAHLMLDDMYAKGYAGLWPWSMFPNSTSDKMTVDWNSVRIFAGRHDDIGPRVTEALAPSTSAPTIPLGFSSTATVIPDRVGPGGLVAIDVDVTSTAGVGVLVDAEVYGPAGDKAYQKFWDNESFGPGQTKRYTFSLTVAPNSAQGEYTVKVGVFSPGWGKVYDWNDNAAKLTVGR